jgi:hypothetical protein
LSSRFTRLLATGVAALFGTGLMAVAAPAAQADGPGVGSGWVVTVGDSYISGEAGRWAGNTNNSASTIDALGSQAYFDNATNNAETINRCHRSKSAEAFIGTLQGKNLACSGATTNTTNDTYFKPGLDFYNGTGGKGQALMLQEFAATNNVKMVVVSIGGNDFGFADVVQRCVQNFLASSSLWKDYCYDDSMVTSKFTASNVSAQRAKIAAAYRNIQTAMRNAGYGDTSWTLLVQNYMSPLPGGSAIRYSQSGYSRQNTGGCGFWNADADWANSTALPTINGAVAGAVADSGLPNVKQLNLASAFNGRRLCENTVGLLEEKGLASWQSAGAVDKTEWIDQIRTVSTATSNYFIQESLHPNYWGQLALRNCVRQAWNVGAPKGGSCTISATGLLNGEPRMKLN